MRHTILGAGGAIGNALAYQLLKSKDEVRLVSRSGYSIPGAESIMADVLSYSETLESIKHSDIVYLCVGLAYDHKLWAESWPKIMQNTIDACKSVQAKLIFFDNVYMYGKVEGKMTEETPYNPCSKKGEIRANIANMLEAEMKSNNIQAIIARSADFYGPYSTLVSVPYVMTIDRFKNGKNAQWLVNEHTVHSYTYTIDAAKALKLLSAADDSFQQVWHLPTFNPGITGEEFISIAARVFGVKPNYTVLKRWVVQMAGLFDKTIAETAEMLYQSDHDYYFDSSKFNDKFNFKPTSYAEGIRETVLFYRNK